MVFKWKFAETQNLLKLVNEDKTWNEISKSLDKCRKVCYKKYKYTLEPSIKKGKWTVVEDSLLSILVKEIGPNWSLISKFINGRIGIQCRQRYMHSLLTHYEGKNNNIKKGRWSASEDELLIKYHGQFGNKWARIGREMETRNGRQCEHRFVYLRQNKIKKNSP